MPEIISRAEAIATGSKTYFTGIPCAKGHVAPRYVNKYLCTVCNYERCKETKAKPHIKQKSLVDGRAYMRRVRATDEYKAQTETEEFKAAERLRDAVRRSDPEYHAKQKVRATKRRSDDAYREKERLKAAARKATLEGYQARCNAQSKYKKANPYKGAKDASYRRAMQLSATPMWLSKEHLAEMEVMYAEASKLTASGDTHHVDHIVPLRSKIVCGLHVPWNLQLLQAFDNLSKNNRWWPDMP